MLDPNRVKDKKYIEISLSSTYSNVHSNHYKDYLKFSKEEVRTNVPPDLTYNKWDTLCDLYETDKWAINLINTKILITFNTSIF